VASRLTSNSSAGPQVTTQSKTDSTYLLQ